MNAKYIPLKYTQWSEARKQRANLYHRMRRAKFRELYAAYAKAQRMARPVAHKLKSKAWKLKNREKVRAHNALLKAVKRGAIIRPGNCSACGVACIPDGHHHNGYENYADVLWLCRPCHKKAHRDL